ncbi:biotin/lipoyl-containing protein, partial [Brevundimonas sp.]|uniref:biotin/lipoyl-containing protein n=1 Tax=Brevundimonas sp. TaxID=1871086 RepID=UPI0025C4D9D0
MGESVAEGSVGTWLKKSGDTVAKDELLVEIETDKVAVEVSAPGAGVLTIAADAGATVTPGQVIGSVSGSGAAAASAPAAAPALGESVSEASIAKWTKKVGDAVRKDEMLVELETDKVSL